MKFGAVPPADALGATAVHSIRQGDFVLKKGTRIGACRGRGAHGCRREGNCVARLDPGDVTEDEAAADIAAAIGDGGVRPIALSPAAAISSRKLRAFWSSTSLRSMRLNRIDEADDS